jgi:protein gp37
MAGRTFVNGHIPLEFYENRLDQPLRWTRPRRIFVNSLSDLFHDDVPDAFILMVFAVMANARQHTFQVLTKRPKRLRAFVSRVRWKVGFDLVEIAGRPHLLAATPCLEGHDRWTRIGGGPPPAPPKELPGYVPENVWIGVSVENNRFRWRIEELLETPAAIRWISAEPLLGDLDVTPYLDRGYESNGPAGWVSLPSLDWVVAGAESGKGFRETKLAWARHLRDQCVTAGVPFLWKQWGGPTPKSRGRALDGRTWDESPKAVAA